METTAKYAGSVTIIAIFEKLGEGCFANTDLRASPGFLCQYPLAGARVVVASANVMLRRSVGVRVQCPAWKLPLLALLR